MAKPRSKPPPPAAERFLGFHSRGGSASQFADGDDLPDLAESDVWYAATPDAPTTTGGWELGGRAGKVYDGPRRVGGLSRAFADGRRQMAASVPIEVPAWPARYAEPELYPVPRAEDKEDVAAGDGWVPPHVYLARRQARASVVEGAGRTLKGRDASRVRDAVWSRTGFDG